jgi:FAD/FMN-containing dehydrogenase
MEWATETRTPLVPVSSGPPHFHGDTVPSAPETTIVDLSRMKAIKRIDRRNRIALIEPGVTYSELEPALAEQGLRITRPLMPRTNKSASTSTSSGRGHQPRSSRISTAIRRAICWWNAAATR